MKATLLDCMGNDVTVADAARVSFAKKSKGMECVDCVTGEYDLREEDKKLIKYLGEHGHYSPFGHCFASFHVKAPIFVARQLVKHKFLRWNEISRRYVDSEPEFYSPPVWRGKAEDKKQGSRGKVDLKEGTISLGDASDSPETALIWFYEDSSSMYSGLLEAGVCPEQARMVLPQSVYTEWHWSGSLDAFANMCNLRCKPDTQEETRMIADQIDNEMKKLFPYSWEALRH